MAKHYQCSCCGSVSCVLWIDCICESCQSLRDLLLLLDPTPLPHGVDFPARKELETENCKVFRGVYRSGWECSSSCPYRIPRSE